MTHGAAALVVEYRSPAHTIACVHGLLGQAIDEVVIVDNSDDDGRAFGILRAALSDDTRVHLHDAGANLGFAAGVNRGLTFIASRSGATRVLLINNDALPDDRLIDGLRAALDEEPAALIAFPSLMHAGSPMAEIYYHRWFATLVSRPMPGAFRVPRGCCMMVAVDRLPGPLFDEVFFMYGEEMALGWRLRHQPQALRHVSSCTVAHEGSVSAEMGSRFYEECTAAAHLLLTRRLANGRVQYCLLYCVRTPALVIRAAVRAIRGRTWRPLVALRAAFGIARAAWRSAYVEAPSPR